MFKKIEKFRRNIFGPLNFGWCLAILFCVTIGAIFFQKIDKHNRPAQRVHNEEHIQPTILVYGTAWCSYCKAARIFLERRGIHYANLDIEKSDEAAKEHQKLGAAVPIIVVNGEVMYGYNEREFRKLLGRWVSLED